MKYEKMPRPGMTLTNVVNIISGGALFIYASFSRFCLRVGRLRRHGQYVDGLGRDLGLSCVKVGYPTSKVSEKPARDVHDWLLPT